MATVAEQGLSRAEDGRVIEVCKDEGRGLVTLDLDFSNPFLFPPDHYAGIAVLRLPRQPNPDDLMAAIQTLVTHLAENSFAGKLWIVERGRIRVYLPGDP